jgi:hypothetical protein
MIVQIQHPFGSQQNSDKKAEHQRAEVAGGQSSAVIAMPVCISILEGRSTFLILLISRDVHTRVDLEEVLGPEADAEMLDRHAA